jgi:NTE family protein
VDPVTTQPFRGVLDQLIDWTAVRTGPLRVFVNASNVRTRELRVFSGGELSTSAVCASICVPFLWEPVEVDGEHYWDGGFLGNPALFPVIYGCEASDIVLIETRPHAFERLPESAGELIARVIDLCSTAGLVREVRAIDFVSELVRKTPGALRPGLREVRIHHVTAHPALASLRGNPFRADLPYFHELHALGEEAGRRWLAEAALLDRGGNTAPGLDGRPADCGAPRVEPGVLSGA